MSNTHSAPLRALGDARSLEPAGPEVLLPAVEAHGLIRWLLVQRDEGYYPGHEGEAAYLHGRLWLVYSELGGYTFVDGTCSYYDGPTLCLAARWLMPAV